MPPRALIGAFLFVVLAGCAVVACAPPLEPATPAVAACAPPLEPATPAVAATATLGPVATATPTPAATATQAAATTTTIALPTVAASETPAAPTPALSLEDQVGIYTAVIRRVYTVDHTFGQDPKFPVVYLIAASGIDPSVREGVLAALATPAVRFEWVEDAQAAPRDENGSVAGGGSVVALGEIQLLPETNKVGLDASIFIAPLAAGGYSYVLEKIDGVWQIVDSNMQWIS